MQRSIDTKTSVTLQNTASTELVPGVRKELISYRDADTDTKHQIETLMSEIDIQDSNSIIFLNVSSSLLISYSSNVYDCI